MALDGTLHKLQFKEFDLEGSGKILHCLNIGSV